MSYVTLGQHQVLTSLISADFNAQKECHPINPASGIPEKLVYRSDCEAPIDNLPSDSPLVIAIAVGTMFHPQCSTLTDKVFLREEDARATGKDFLDKKKANHALVHRTR